jgi:hypothetical protein
MAADALQARLQAAAASLALKSAGWQAATAAPYANAALP